jgi:formylglycine-generating enzyme required for sulfatase activity
VARGSSVNLTVSKGPEPVAVAVPNVVGMTQTAAQSALTSAGLTLGTVTEQYHATVPAGLVIGQDPIAGTSVAPGSAVALTVSKGSEPVTTETILLSGGVPLEMVWIPAGDFNMGRYTDEVDSYDEEDPQHPVSLTQDFWMGKYELTKAQWTAVMGTTPWSGLDYVLDDPDSPAVYISWDMIAGPGGFIETLNAANPGMNFRLPSEAQWEYACRAGTTTRFYWGDDPSYTDIGNYAWYEGNDYAGQEYAHVVSQKLPNAWGLYDMSGNVFEYCQDCWHNNYTGAPADGSAWELPTSSYRVLRGGGWYSRAYYCRSAGRSGGSPGDAYYSLGVRIVRTP